MNIVFIILVGAGLAAVSVLTGYVLGTIIYRENDNNKNNQKYKRGDMAFCKICSGPIKYHIEPLGEGWHHVGPNRLGLCHDAMFGYWPDNEDHWTKYI